MILASSQYRKIPVLTSKTPLTKCTQYKESTPYIIRDTNVNDILSLLDDFWMKYSDGIEILHSFFITRYLLISHVPLCKRIFKNEGGSFKFIHTVNVAIFVSELTKDFFHILHLQSMIPWNNFEIFHPN